MTAGTPVSFNILKGKFYLNFTFYFACLKRKLIIHFCVILERLRSSPAASPMGVVGGVGVGGGLQAGVSTEISKTII